MSEWFSEDGLMHLDPEDDQPGFNGYPLRTVKNANGIFYLTVNAFLQQKMGIAPNRDAIIEVLLRLMHPKIPGMLCRHPADTNTEEAQDNYAAAIALCNLIDAPEIAKMIYTYGSSRGFNFEIHGDWKIEEQRQPGEVAYYALGARYIPELFSWMWFLLGLIVNAFSGTDQTKHNYASDAQLALVRVMGTDWLLDTPGGGYPSWVRGSWGLVSSLWKWRTTKKYGHILGMLPIFYTNPSHPNYRISRYLMGVGDHP